MHTTRKKIVNYVLMTLLTLLFIFPTFFMVVSALKEDELQILRDMTGILGFVPYGPIGLQNFRDVFGQMAFGRFFFNSLLIVGVTVALGLIVNSMIAYALARLRFKGSNFVIMFIVALLIIPVESIVIPMLLMVNSWGIVDTYQVQILPFIADPLYIFLLYQFFRDLPKSLEEAAIIDGLSYFGIYRSITLPLSKPALVSVAILASIARWGEFLWPLLVTRVSTYRPLTVAMQQLFSIDPTYWGDIFAFASMMTLPLLIIFVIFQKHFVESIARTGIKG